MWQSQQMLMERMQVLGRLMDRASLMLPFFGFKRFPESLFPFTSGPVTIDPTY